MALTEKQRQIKRKLVGLLSNFETELRSDDLREKVRALIPAFGLLRRLGTSMFPREEASSGRDRILAYLKKYPRMVIEGNELMIVSGIGEWARRVRELRVQFGWHIVGGVTAKQMAESEESPLEGIDTSDMGPKDYMLLDATEDRDAAHRWNVANVIRRRKSSVQSRVLEYLRANVGHEVTGEELRYVARNKTSWARRTRELRTDLGWPVVTKGNGNPRLRVGVYVLEQDRQGPPHDRCIPDELRRQVKARDDYRCQNCKWSYGVWNKADPRILELHHKLDHVKGGPNTLDNLTTLCSVCHDRIHAHHHSGKA